MAKTINLSRIDFGGGGGAPVPPVPPVPPTPTPAGSSDVNFRDYDGSIVASYTAEEFAALTAMPANPTHEGLTSQGWNWSLANAQAYVAKYGRLEVGQMYITSDGKTRIHINLYQYLSPYLGLGINGSVEIDWGDGSTPDTMTGSDADQYIKRQHVYDNPGAYLIEVTPAEGTEIHLLGEPNGYGGLIVGADSSDSSHYYWLIERVNIGRGVTIIGTGLWDAKYLRYITIPQGVTIIDYAAFEDCYSLHSISIPDSVTDIGDYAFYECYSLHSISIPDSVTEISNGMFYYCYSLQSISIPDSVTFVGDYAFEYCYSLQSISIPDSVTDIGEEAFDYCLSLATITVCATTPPYLTTPFWYSPPYAVIYVPAESVDAYKAATNWNYYPFFIQPMPE